MNEIQSYAQNNEGKENESSSSESIYLTFYVAEQLFGIPIAQVVQIVGAHKIIAMPEYPPYAKGIINLRGSIIPVIDIRIRLQKEEKEYNERTCIIVMNIDSQHVGFIVDAVDEVTNIQKDEVEDVPQMGSDYSHRFITNIGKLGSKVVLLLDARKVYLHE